MVIKFIDSLIKYLKDFKNKLVKCIGLKEPIPPP